MNCKSAFFGILGFFIVSIIAVVYLSLGWMDVDFLDKTTLSKHYIKKDEVNFYDLPSDIQQRYVYKDSTPQNNKPKPETKKSDDTKLKKLVIENENLKNEIASLLEQKKSTPTKKQKEEADKESFALLADSPTYTIRCSNFKDNQHFITPSCRKMIDDYLSAHTNPAHFEMIAMVDLHDYHNFKSSNDDQAVNRLVDEGLAKLRAKEVGWYIRQKAPNGSFYSFPPYQFTTKKTKGVVINIY